MAKPISSGKGGVGAQFAAFVDSEYVKGNRSADRALAPMIDTIRHGVSGNIRMISCSRRRQGRSEERIVRVKSPR